MEDLEHVDKLHHQAAIGKDTAVNIAALLHLQILTRLEGQGGDTGNGDGEGNFLPTDLTDDGELKNRLTHPKHSVPKVYRVKVAEEVTEEKYMILTSPLIIDGYKIRPVEVTVGEHDESGTVLRMTLYEGRNRQIRKMCEQAGLTVKRLSRLSIGNIKLDGLPVGKWRYLEQNEVDYLYRATSGKEN